MLPYGLGSHDTQDHAGPNGIFTSFLTLIMTRKGQTLPEGTSTGLQVEQSNAFVLIILVTLHVVFPAVGILYVSIIV